MRVRLQSRMLTPVRYAPMKRVPYRFEWSNCSVSPWIPRKFTWMISQSWNEHPKSREPGKDRVQQETSPENRSPRRSPDPGRTAVSARRRASRARMLLP